MSDRRRLYSPGPHYVLKGFTGLWFGAVLYMVVLSATEGSVHDVLGGLAFAAFGALVFGPMIWRAQVVHATRTHLEVGWQRRVRRVPLEQIVDLEKPGWAYLDRYFVPLYIRLETGKSILFFPSNDGELFVRTRVARNTDPAVAASYDD